MLYTLSLFIKSLLSLIAFAGIALSCIWLSVFTDGNPSVLEYFPRIAMLAVLAFVTFWVAVAAIKFPVLNSNN